MDIFAFFKFYFYSITRNDKRYSLLNNQNTMFPILITPVILFIIHMMSSFVAVYYSPLSTILTLTMPIWAFVILVNLIYTNTVRDAFWKRERVARYEKKKREDSERRKYEEADRLYRAYWHQKLEREKEERQERERRERWERMHNHSSTINQNNNTNHRNSLTLMGLNDGASEREIKSAYKKLAKVHHPDLGGTHNNFIKLKKAYDYLMNK